MTQKFSNAQKEAVMHKEGPCLVLAGPGSGKTLVITHRTNYLIKRQGIDPSKILVITFTKAAATEMKERFQNLEGNQATRVNFGTFHAVFFTILRHAYGFKADNILKEEKKYEILKGIIEILNLEFDDEADFISSIAAEISMVKNDRILLEHYYATNCSTDIFRRIYKLYEENLRKARMIDFDDMLVYSYELFKERKDILQAWQKKYQYILIDEFQDINKVQYDVIKMLAAPENNLFIVGDDDQSIYRFRGARPEIMLGFEKDYPEVKKIILDRNFRSTQQIVQGALRVIRNNKQRFEKEIIATGPSGNSIEWNEFENQTEENKEIVKKIQEYVRENGRFSDMAVLYRTNIQPRMLIQKLMEYNIPFRMKDNLPNLYEHWIAKNIISYIKIAMGSRERKEFLPIINRPNRYINRECLDNEWVSFEEMRIYYEEKEWMCDRIDKMEYDIKVLANMRPFAAVNYIRHGIGYEEYLAEYATYRHIKKEELLEVLDELQSSAKEFQNFEAWFLHMEEFAQELKEQVRKQGRNQEGVSLATMHSAKGLEYKKVFIIDANEGIIPYRKAILDADMEEERRMFYVAMTRAKEELVIYSIKERFNKNLEVSRFVTEGIDLPDPKKQERR